MSIVEVLRAHVRERLRPWGIGNGSRVLCAVSGGVDSVVLLELLFELSSELGFLLAVAHADHGLRGRASEEDAEFVRQLAGERGLSVMLERLPVREYARTHRCSLQVAARTLRYEFLQRSARSFGATHVALAHTLDDNAETVLLNLLRGSGLEGLAGIPPCRELFPGCWLIRPLLSVRKEQLYAYARTRGIPWRDDASNRDRRFRRNRLRWDVLPRLEELVPAAITNIARCSSLLRQALEGIEQLLRPLLQQAALPGGGFFFADSSWDALPPFFRLELLRLGLRQLGVPYGPPAEHALRALDLRNAPTGKRLVLTQGVLLVREHAGLSLLPPAPPLPSLTLEPRGRHRVGPWMLEFEPVECAAVRFGDDPTTEVLDAERLPPLLQWRPPQPGDRFHPLGMPKEIKLGDFLTNQRLPFWRRRLLTVLADGQRVLWVCGVRLSDTVKLTPQTRRCLRLRLLFVGYSAQPEHGSRTD
ncbi:tRNA(Ile)-lysidine synthase [bacterium HR21]|nr:tRNA(Ile)-lysidine synthase [bacterium HR21]